MYCICDVTWDWSMIKLTYEIIMKSYVFLKKKPKSNTERTIKDLFKVRNNRTFGGRLCPQCLASLLPYVWLSRSWTAMTHLGSGLASFHQSVYCLSLMSLAGRKQSLHHSSRAAAQQSGTMSGCSARMIVRGLCQDHCSDSRSPPDEGFHPSFIVFFFIYKYIRTTWYCGH